MAAIAGKDGLAKLGANTITQVQSWSLDITQDLLDSHALGDEWKEVIEGLNDWTASIEFSWDIPNDANGQTALQTALLNGTSVTLDLYTNASNYYEGTAYVSSFSIETPVDGKVSGSMELKGSGALTYN